MLAAEDLKKLELHAEHAQRAGEVLAKVRDLHAEATTLQAQKEQLVAQVATLRQIVGQAGQIIRSIDGIYKTPGVTVQRNYEDFLEPELRQLHDRFMRGVL